MIETIGDLMAQGARQIGSWPCRPDCQQAHRLAGRRRRACLGDYGQYQAAADRDREPGRRCGRPARHCARRADQTFSSIKDDLKAKMGGNRSGGLKVNEQSFCPGFLG